MVVDSVKTSASSSLPPLPDYDNAPAPFWTRHAWWAVPAAVFLSTVVLTILSFPPYDLAEFAYAFGTPAILWAYRRPRWKTFVLVVLGAHAVAWTIVLAWLHHVTWAGLLLLGPFIGSWVGSWFLVARWVVPHMPGAPMLLRLLAVLGLAGAWVVIEWTRTWLLSGFPWLPLAASQWLRPSILQVAAFTGSGGISFVLVAMNIGFAAFAHRLVFERAQGLNRRSQEFFLAMFLLIACLSIHIAETVNRSHFQEPIGRVGFVQPNVPQTLKWDPAQAPAIMQSLERITMDVAARRPDLILWPEAVTPWAVRGDVEIQQWAEQLVQRAGAPLFLGSIGIEEPDASGGPERWLNAAFLITPAEGLADAYYAKRHLVPFGEYVPLRPLLGWLRKFVPIGDDFTAGTAPALMYVPLRGQVLTVGPLICYEDIFPALSRDSVRAGADLLVVVTNNGWFGEGGAAYQHAAHSVLRAVETRRPVLRVGNGGWSGWIDEFGTVRAEFRRITRTTATGTTQAVVTSQPRDRRATDADPGTIYFRGSGVVDVTRDTRLIGQRSAYVKYGDWFVLVSLALFGLGVAAVRVGRPATPPTPAAEAPVAG